MIKRLVFAPRDPGPTIDDWTGTTARGADAPADARPRRIVWCSARPDLVPSPAHAGVGIEWFDDAEHLARFRRWADAGAAPLPAGAEVVVADEHVARGADWLAERWARGGPCLKHMAIARRAPGLTPAAFSERWQGRAGRVGTTPIPDDAKGRAYAQNHPVARADGGDWRYDAVNEVWFDDVAALRTRIGFMDSALAGGADSDMISEHSFIAVEEVVLSDG